MLLMNIKIVIRKMNIDEMNDIISKIDFDNICYIKCLGKES